MRSCRPRLIYVEIAISTSSGGTGTVFESTIRPGGGPPFHVHANEDEVWYALEGTFRVKLEDDVQDAPGVRSRSSLGVCRMPGRTSETRPLDSWSFAPAGLERLFERSGQPPDDASDWEAFRRLGSEVGMDVVGPPLAQSNPL